jgi:hypothetical protein
LRRARGPLLIAALAAVAAGGPAAAQRPVPPDTLAAMDTLVADTVDDRISPRAAFIRSLLVPGWGQASVGSYGRGAVFFAIQGTSTYMLLRTIARLGQARAVENRVVGIITDSINQAIARDTMADACMADPARCDAARSLAADTVAFETAVGQEESVARMRGLVESREDQRQDWTTYLLFFTLMGGVDAYVNRHLQDFPADVVTTTRPGGRYTVGLRVWVGGR